MDLKYRKFGRRDFDEYRSWYSDALLNEALGPAVDHEWLDYVLSDETGIQYVAILDERLVGTFGLVKPVPEFRFWALTDIAVNPEYRKQGIASTILAALPELTGTNQVVAFVMQNNKVAFEMFTRAGWLKDESLHSDMYRFEMAAGP